MSTLKRKRPLSAGAPKELTPDEKAILTMIQSRENIGITVYELKREMVKTMKEKVLSASIKSLKEKARIKEVKNVQNKRTHLMASEFQPSVDLTGGAWFSEGQLDTTYIENLAKVCSKLIRDRKVVTAEAIQGVINSSKAFKDEVSAGQIQEILKNLVWGGEVARVKSTGIGEYESIPAGSECYKSIRKVQQDEDRSIGAMVSIPCGVCPRIDKCTPDGAISPITCVYFNKWLDF